MTSHTHGRKKRSHDLEERMYGEGPSARGMQVRSIQPCERALEREFSVCSAELFFFGPETQGQQRSPASWARRMKRALTKQACDVCSRKKRQCSGECACVGVTAGKGWLLPSLSLARSPTHPVLITIRRLLPRPETCLSYCFNCCSAGETPCQRCKRAGVQCTYSVKAAGRARPTEALGKQRHPATKSKVQPAAPTAAPGLPPLSVSPSTGLQGLQESKFLSVFLEHCAPM